LHRRGEDSRLEGSWGAPVREEEDVLSDDEIAMQWEYNVIDPHSPKLAEVAKNESEDGDAK
jgi:GTP-binding protein